MDAMLLLYQTVHQIHESYYSFLDRNKYMYNSSIDL
mgnify:CR=1 FL=1